MKGGRGLKKASFRVISVRIGEITEEQSYYEKRTKKCAEIITVDVDPKNIFGSLEEELKKLNLERYVDFILIQNEINKKELNSFLGEFFKKLELNAPSPLFMGKRIDG